MGCNIDSDSLYILYIVKNSIAVLTASAYSDFAEKKTSYKFTKASSIKFSFLK